ncbi:MAG: dimethyl sulfoxide reductase anchor subunit [Xanthomonadales bacterium]|nr:dimethyl sulfoxide reductase anchor subunit [Xanthomonadales bacterium]
MHPAASVIAFTTLSGAGYGLLVWLGLLVAFGQAGRSPALVLTALLLGGMLVGAGLLASLAHLGRPERAWRAFSQWRTSWLSREGVAAVASFVPIAGLGWAVLSGAAPAWRDGFALALVPAALVTLVCTARIYDTLRPIPAWHNRWVLPGFLALAAASGGALLWALGVLAFALPPHRGDGFVLLVLLALAAAVKWAYWRHIDRHPGGVAAAAALALPAGSAVRSFEAPHTEANFLMREMGFALARKHGARLRRVCLALLVGLPALALVASWLWPGARPAVAALVAGSVLVATALERWLFFAQARHLVTTWYSPERPWV